MATNAQRSGLFTRIVVGTDGSDTAEEALRQAIELARLTGAELGVVSAFQPVSKRRVQGEAEGAPADIQNQINPNEDVNLVLDAAAAKARAAGVGVTTHPIQDDPADAILNVAEKTDADLIVVGNKGMTGARRYLLGSVPNNISHHAPCSVIIVRTT